MVYALAVVAALIVAFGEVVQQRMAAQAPPQDNLSPKLLLWLVQQPRWLAGVVCSLLGNVAFAAALGRGSVVLVEAVFVVRLLFGLSISAFWGWHRIPAKDIIGGLVIAFGLVAFLLAARPRGGVTAVADVRWAYGAGCPVALAALLAVVASRRSGSSRALLLGIGAGILFGVQAALVQSAVHVMGHHGLAALLAGWHGYAVVVVALFGMLLVQSAFESAELSASYPGVVTAQLLCALAIGVFVLRGRLDLATGHVVVILLGLGAMIAGIVIVTRSTFHQGHLAQPSASPRLEHQERE
ncbi:MAG TPA: DMT family transporter [Nocardioidaceae bacterium]|jgi:hypothetical protein|nr:DMT family transporter [Nocardioidaceae bacterium]